MEEEDKAASWMSGQARLGLGCLSPQEAGASMAAQCHILTVLSCI